MFDVRRLPRRSFLAQAGFDVFLFLKGRVAESGLRHSTRNRAWGNPPWVRIPPLPPFLSFNLISDVLPFGGLWKSTIALASAQQREFFTLSGAPRGTVASSAIRNLECSLREEHGALSEANALYRRVAFLRFEQTLFVQIARIF